ncbi:hypothetical protein ZHAS_00012060 [Anopheles sinensis]|uniref:SAM_MT_RSMB_NOP domain-containing protein n=1 Tax=Anopheles sinensis TaxID=74873 RepID=A0A084W1V5_ANOSI|nr:hypothetical protein ZHAS_00012060 [Anopheles sinensis]
MVRDGTENQKQHKIPVPTNYRMAAKYLRQALHEKKSIKSELVAGKHFRTGRTIMHRLTTNMPQINAIMTNIDLLKKEPKLNEWLARVLIGELLFGRGELNGMSLPVECVRRYESEIWEEFEKTKDQIKPLTRSLKEPRFVRINTITLNLEGAKRMMEEEGWILVDEEFADYSSFLERVRALGDSEYMACLVPTYLLNPSKKSVVLDMCSAPGLKATHLACLMKNKGRLYAVERNEERYKVLCKYTTDFGVIKTIHGDCFELTDEQVPGVQYILIDPSCSGSGMLNRIDASEPVDEDRLYKLSGLQYKLLTHAMNGFPNAKRIVYSTCSVHEQENERVVESVLRHNGHFKLLDAREELGKEWLNLGSDKYPGIGERCLYARTEIDLTIGMFVAVFERCAEGEVNEFYVQNQTYREKNAPKNKRDNHNSYGEETEVAEKPKKKKHKKQNF